MSIRLFDATKYEPNDDERTQLASHGVVRVPLDIPWPLAPVNVAVIKAHDSREKPLALIDAGLRYQTNRMRLEAALAQSGYELGDIGEIWLTHPHIDHFGLTGEIVAATGATVHCFAATKPRFHDYLTHWTSDRAWVRDAFQEAGVPDELLDKTLSRGSSFEAMGGPLRIDHTFGDGDEVWIAGRRATALHVPGHSPWCTAFWFEEERLLVSGDALLETISSNPILYPPDVGEPTWQGLPAYRRSLSRLAALPAALVLPGHGRAFSGHVPIVERQLDAQRKRQARVVEAMEAGATTGLAVAEAVFGQARTHKSLFLIMSEILRHLDWLEAEGRLQRLRHASDEPWCFELRRLAHSAA